LEPPTPIHDYAKTLGRTRRESPMATKAPPAVIAQQQQKSLEMKPLKLKKLLRAKMMMMNQHQHQHQHQHQEDHFKMFTWSPYSSHMMQQHHYDSLPAGPAHPGPGGKSLDELRF
jgi:hypothetical protein